jgi:hypothetical protein
MEGEYNDSKNQKQVSKEFTHTAKNVILHYAFDWNLLMASALWYMRHV